jgi:MoaA/NifB/PqqE/SkfB family radical SAM enzyme
MTYGFRNMREKSFPSMIVLDVARVCNSRCIHCAYDVVHHDPQYPKEPAFMEWSIFQKVADECGSFPDVNLRFTCHGEPLLHPALVDMVGYAKKNGISPVSLNTNGSLLNREKALMLLETGIDVIEVSLDACSKERYEEIRKGLSFEKTMENVHNLIRLKQETRSRTKIFVSIIEQPEVQEEISAFEQYWAPKVEKVIRRVYFTHDGITSSQKVSFRIPDRRHPCPFLWKRIVVTAQGRVKFCLEDWYDRKVTPFPSSTPIHEVWTSEWYDELRDRHLSLRFQEVEFCNSCKDWWSHWWENDYLHALGIGGEKRQ